MRSEEPRRNRRIVTYERVSSEDQRERATIKMQMEQIAGRLKLEVEVELIGRYIDDGISGTIPMGERPQGRRLLDDAAKGLFDEVWVYKIDRLGRDDVDPLVVWQQLERLGVKVHSVTEGVSTTFEYHIRVAMAAEERRTFLERSASGMESAVRQGRYPGGIVPLGFVADGKKHEARLTPSEAIISGAWTEAEIVRKMYRWLGQGWSCVRIANHLNSLGVPPAYVKDGRLVRERGGVRKRRTQGKWRPGRIRNIVVNPVYKGEYHYGRRSKRSRDVIVVSVPELVPKELWEQAQRALAKNRLGTPGAKTNVYLLRSITRCALCGLNFCGTKGRGVVWYRCNGQIAHRGKFEGRCPAKSIRGDVLERIVWEDVERFLLNPGDILDELLAEQGEGTAGVEEAERILVEQTLESIPEQRNRIIDAYRRSLITSPEFDTQMDGIAREENQLKKQLEDLTPSCPAPDELTTADALQQIRRRLHEGLSDRERQEIVATLVRQITVHTEVCDSGKRAKIVIEYLFGAVGDDHSDRGSSPRRA